MATKKTYVISDIHMGTNVATNWYRDTIHQPYLEHILDEIINNPSEVDELIILGDLFDYWTYPPEQEPPTAKEIVDANSDILGPTGKINDVLNALKGNVYYVRGNHDITTTESDLRQIGDPTSDYFVQFPPKPEGATGFLADNCNFYLKDGVIYTHGHFFTMFNAPPKVSNPSTNQTLPVGHFVTRAISYQIHHYNQLHPDHKKAAADEHDFGAPHMGLSAIESLLPPFPDTPSKIPAFLKFIKNLPNTSITKDLLEAVRHETGIPPKLEISLKGGN